MHVLITAGGTSEPIDTVRKITNTSSGRLAATIYRQLLQHKISTGLSMTLHYVVGSATVLPEFDGDTYVYHVTDTESVEKTMQDILRNQTIDIVLHLMAISDYYVAAVKSTHLIAQNLSEFIQECHESKVELTTDLLSKFLENPSCTDLSQEGKLSSKDDLYIQLKQTPKIIEQIKKISPGTRLIGFKLMDHVSEQVLVDTATQQCKVNRCEFVVGNDLKTVGPIEHHALLVRDGLVLDRCHTKDEIASSIIKELGI